MLSKDFTTFYFLNPHGGYVKIDAYLLQFLCHMTSDAKFSHMLFFLIYIGLFYEVKEL